MVAIFSQDVLYVLFLVFFSKVTSYLISKGSNFRLTLPKPEVDLTPEMIAR